MAPRRGSGASIDGVSDGYRRGAVGGSEGAQLRSPGPQSSPVSWHLGVPFVMFGV